MGGILNNPCYDNNLDKRFLINVIKWINFKDLPSLCWWIGELSAVLCLYPEDCFQKSMRFYFSFVKISKNITTHLCSVVTHLSSSSNLILYPTSFTFFFSISFIFLYCSNLGLFQEFKYRSNWWIKNLNTVFKINIFVLKIIILDTWNYFKWR